MVRAFPLITAIIALTLLLASCSPTLKEATPDLPPGFLEVRVPDGDFSAYLYLSQESPTVMPVRHFGEIKQTADKLKFATIPADLEIDWLGLATGPDLDSFGGTIRFESASINDHSTSLAEMTETVVFGNSEVMAWHVDNELFLVHGTGGWADAMKLALQSQDTQRFQDAHPAVWDLLRLLPERPPTKPVAAGFVRVKGGLLDSLSAKAGLGLGGLAQALGAINVTDIAFVAYADAPLTPLAEIGPDYFNQVGAGAILVMRSGYPGFLLSFFLNTFADRLELEAGSVMTGEDVLIREFEDVHLIVKSLGNILLVSLATNLEKAETLMTSALELHV